MISWTLRHRSTDRVPPRRRCARGAAVSCLARPRRGGSRGAQSRRFGPRRGIPASRGVNRRRVSDGERGGGVPASGLALRRGPALGLGRCLVRSAAPARRRRALRQRRLVRHPDRGAGRKRPPHRRHRACRGESARVPRGQEAVHRCPRGCAPRQRYVVHPPVFLDAVAPSIALSSAARGGRVPFPHPRVVSRYADAGIAMYSTSHCGAITVEFSANRARRPRISRFERETNRRYWHARGLQCTGAPPPGR